MHAGAAVCSQYVKVSDHVFEAGSVSGGENDRVRSYALTAAEHDVAVIDCLDRRDDLDVAATYRVQQADFDGEAMSAFAQGRGEPGGGRTQQSVGVGEAGPVQPE
jgi:hypothetical protein